MDENQFFKPTALYKEYMILDMIEKNPNITQREMSKAIGIAVSMVNDYLDKYEKNNLIIRKKHTTKTVEYFITKTGLERKKLLNIWYLQSSQTIYISAKDNILKFLYLVIAKGFRNILLYGAGEVAEIMLQVLTSDNTLPLHVIAIIDDNPLKTGKVIINSPIIQLKDIGKYEHDGILVSSFKHHQIINSKLHQLNYPAERIINFFDN